MKAEIMTEYAKGRHSNVGVLLDRATDTTIRMGEAVAITTTFLYLVVFLPFVYRMNETSGCIPIDIWFCAEFAGIN
jgi:hypothetical protein